MKNNTENTNEPSKATYALMVFGLLGLLAMTFIYDQFRQNGRENFVNLLEKKIAEGAALEVGSHASLTSNSEASGSGEFLVQSGEKFRVYCSKDENDQPYWIVRNQDENVSQAREVVQGQTEAQPALVALCENFFASR